MVTTLLSAYLVFSAVSPSCSYKLITRSVGLEGQGMLPLKTDAFCEVRKVKNDLVIKATENGVTRTVTSPVSRLSPVEDAAESFLRASFPDEAVRKKVIKSARIQKVLIAKNVTINGILCTVDMSTLDTDSVTITKTSYIPVDSQLRELIDTVMTVESIRGDGVLVSVTEYKSDIRFKKGLSK